MDKVALVENGKIVKSGTHKELITKRDKYFNLIRKTSWRLSSRSGVVFRRVSMINW